MKDRFVLAALLLALMPGVVCAQAVYKCVIKGKPPSYQSEPCPSNAKIAAIREYQPESPPTYEQIQNRHRQEAKGRQESAYLSRIAGTDGRANTASGHLLQVGGSECENAKRGRDAWERRVGLSRSFDTLRTWNDRVQRACR